MLKLERLSLTLSFLLARAGVDSSLQVVSDALDDLRRMQARGDKVDPEMLQRMEHIEQVLKRELGI